MARNTAAVAPAASPISKTHTTRTDYVYTRLGNDADATTSTTFGIALEGGGEDVDASFTWMSNLAPGGDFLVLQFSTTDLGYNPYVLDLSGTDRGGTPFNSVATLMLPSRAAADDPAVADIIDKAEAIYIGGGSQADYITNWTGTKTQAALNRSILDRNPIGGISAGMAVLGQHVYSGLYQSLTSNKALANPYDRNLTLAEDFVGIDLLAGTITDTHFESRDRMGRSVTFLARLAQLHGSTRSIAVNAGTALLIDAKGIGTVVARQADPAYPAGSTSVYFLSGPALAPTDIVKLRTPLTYRNVAVTKVMPGGSFDVRRWGRTTGLAQRYSLCAVEGELTVDGAATIYG